MLYTKIAIEINQGSGFRAAMIAVKELVTPEEVFEDEMEKIRAGIISYLAEVPFPLSHKVGQVLERVERELVVEGIGLMSHQLINLDPVNLDS